MTTNNNKCLQCGRVKAADDASTDNACYSEIFDLPDDECNKLTIERLKAERTRIADFIGALWITCWPSPPSDGTPPEDPNDAGREVATFIEGCKAQIAALLGELGPLRAVAEAARPLAERHHSLMCRWDGESDESRCTCGTFALVKALEALETTRATLPASTPTP